MVSCKIKLDNFCLSLVPPLFASALLLGGPNRGQFHTPFLSLCFAAAERDYCVSSHAFSYSYFVWVDAGVDIMREIVNKWRLASGATLTGENDLGLDAMRGVCVRLCTFPLSDIWYLYLLQLIRFWDPDNFYAPRVELGYSQRDVLLFQEPRLLPVRAYTLGNRGQSFDVFAGDRFCWYRGGNEGQWETGQVFMSQWQFLVCEIAINCKL